MKKLLFVLSMTLLLLSCEKDPLTPDNNTSTPATPTPNACPGADGAMWAVNSITTYNPGFGVPATEINLGTGIAFFSSNGLSGNPMTRVSAGTVTLNSNATDYLGETYITKFESSNINGVDFSNGVTWEVSGDNGFGSYTHSPTNPFPTASKITSGAVVTKANGYTLTCNTITSADSVLFLVSGVSKTLGGSATSCTFSASELSSVATGENQLVQIVPYTMSSAVVGGKTICFGKEMVQQLSVTVQ